MNMKFMQWCSRAVYSYQQANIWIVSYQGVFSGLNDIQDEFSIENLNLGKWLLPPLPGLCCVPLNSNSSSKNVPVSTKFHTLLTRQDLAVCWSEIWAQNNSKPNWKKVSFSPPSQLLWVTVWQWQSSDDPTWPAEMYSRLQLFFVPQSTWSHCPVWQEEL